MNDTDKLINLIKKSTRIVFLGGAGVSTESGLKDFRSKDGLYSEKYKFPPEVILSHSFFISQTDQFYEFYKKKLNSLKYKPNITHYVLAKMEKKGMLDCVITQNIDGFHQEAGSLNVLELHGSINRNYCLKCHKFYDASYVFNSKKIPLCSCGGIIKPDVVLYEEPLNYDTLEKAILAISNCDLLIIGGTSLNVYPAASLINYFKGRNIVLINHDTTLYDNRCSLIINDNIGDVFKKIEKEIL